MGLYDMLCAEKEAIHQKMQPTFDDKPAVPAHIIITNVTYSIYSFCFGFSTTVLNGYAVKNIHHSHRVQ